MIAPVPALPLPLFQLTLVQELSLYKNPFYPIGDNLFFISKNTKPTSDPYIPSGPLGDSG
jgi:hypothetical protein